MNQNPHLIVICGPTGIGKTGVAIRLAEKLKCEIISADSRQLFSEMSIGTAVPSAEELARVPHHFIRSRSVADPYNASMYEQDVIRFLDNYFKHKDRIIMAGGSGMYIDAVCRGIDDLPTIRPGIRTKWRTIFESKGISFLQEKVREVDPDYFERVDRQNHKRLLKAIEVYEQTGKSYSSFLKHEPKKRYFDSIKIGLNTDRQILYEQINHRVGQMIGVGLVEEARRLLPYRDLSPLKTVGYQELFDYFDGLLSLEEAVQKIRDHSRAYARRQITWFRRDPDIRWFEPDQETAILKWTEEKINA
jgi:tRNA dimethylallyltransferase